MDFLFKKRLFVFTVRVSLYILLFAGLFLFGCYPKKVGVAPDGKQLTWAEMNLSQRKALMANEVVPRAGAIFRSWRPEHYAEINCTLCHGENAKKGNFHMPTAHLPRLSGELLLGPEREKHPNTTRLKMDELVPIMSETLGVKSFSLITRRGFGCYSCHLGPDGPMFGN